MEESNWTSVGFGLGPALLSITGTGTDDVWITGAAGALLHGDGSAWTVIEGLGDGDLWWTSLTDTSAWVCGASGKIFRIDRQTMAIEDLSVDTATTFYGIYAVSDDELWTVGGDPEAASDAAQLWHRVGGEWSQVELDPTVSAELALYKAWGTGAGDVWVVGSGGIAMHYDGAAWTLEDTVTTSRLFTVHGNGTDTYAVGGEVAGEVYHWSGSQWINESPAFTQQFSGIYAPAQGDPVLVGAGGGVYIREGGTWVQDEGAKAETFQDLHAVWVDPDGGIWAVGGHVSGLPLIQGVLIYSGSATIPTLEGI